ncbi:transposase [Nonomuraea sp. H19]|uniref:transposase n=1 Tax=Nonomuraea sp. H19 TaxID=3452206 RepID=UPI003F8BA1C6
MWHGPDGIRVEVIILNDRPRLRVTQRVNGRRYLVADCSRAPEVAAYVDLADLCEVIDFPR